MILVENETVITAPVITETAPFMQWMLIFWAKFKLIPSTLY
jgi:hypothetical protein